MVAKRKPPLPGRLALALTKRLGKDSTFLMRDKRRLGRRDDIVPTGMKVLDHHVLGVGGLVRGRIYEVFGDESAGKTTLLNKIMAGWTLDGGAVYFQDAEVKYDEDWAQLHGVDPEKVLMTQTQGLEEWHGAVIEALEGVTRSDKLLVALDSVAALAPKKVVESDIEKQGEPGLEARAWAKFFKVAPRLLAEKGATMVLINQVRSKIGVMFGNPETTPGGKALKHHASVRLKVNPGFQIKEGENTVARGLIVSAVKNQLAKPFQKGEFRLRFAEGFDEAWSVLEYAKKVGCIAKAAKADDPEAVAEAIANLGWDSGVAVIPPPAKPSAGKSKKGTPKAETKEVEDDAETD
jgi:recombination protein RecA